MACSKTLSFASLFFSVVLAVPGGMPWVGPMPTPVGLMATAGMSPRPTKAPTPDFLPGELRRRQNVQFPPPLNWCGFISSQYNDPLSCVVGRTCVNSGPAMGCCTATTGICTALYTACNNYLDTCDSSCKVDVGIKKCSSALPFCGTYSFFGGTYLYNCQSTSMAVAPVEFLNDYYATAIGSTVGGASTDPLANTGLVSLGTAAAVSSTTSSSVIPTSTDSPTYTYYTSGGLSAAAIDGIAAACSILGAAILGIIAFFCLRRRRRRRMAHASQGMAQPSQYAPTTQMPPGPPMQQSPMAPPKAFGSYQSVPQQEDQKLYPQYPSPSADQQHPPQGPPSYFSPPQGQSPNLATSPPSTGGLAPPHSPPIDNNRQSTTAPSFLSTDPSTDPRHSYYKPPASDAREVDATMGNPGVPSPMSGHGNLQQPHQANEVDATMGNPSVPMGGHGIPVQGVPGGSPSSTEIMGNPVRASLNAPFSADGPYEMGGDHR